MAFEELNVLCSCVCGYKEERVTNIGKCPKCGRKVKARFILDSKFREVLPKKAFYVKPGKRR